MSQSGPDIVTAALLVIGDEILSGRTKDKNIGFIAEYLTAIGIDLKEVRVVPDEEAEIVAGLNALRSRYTYVFTTGGIGPTHDDITADSVAKAFGVSIDVDPRVVAMFKQRAPHLDLNEARLRMARIPAGRRAGREQGLDRAGFHDRQRDRHGRRAVDHAGDARCGFRQAAHRARRCCRKPCCANAREGDIGTPLGEIAKAYPDAMIGSYPFFDGQGPNTNIVVRSREPQMLAAVKAAVEEMLVKINAAR